MAMRGDFNVLKFDTYAEYLESFTRSEDRLYLSSKGVINSLIKLGYRTNATIYEEEEFYNQRKHLFKLMNPIKATVKLFGSFLKNKDPALVALAQREERNRQKKLSTIIFLQMRQSSGFDISGYIDYADSLRAATLHLMGATDWRAIFEGRILLRPERTHLSFFDWHSGNVFYNNTENYEIMHHGASLMFKHLGDHKLIPVTTVDSIYKENVKRTSIRSPMYECIVLYDHIVRKAT